MKRECATSTFFNRITTVYLLLRMQLIFYFAYVNTELFVLKSMFAKVFCKVLAY